MSDEEDFATESRLEQILSSELAWPSGKVGYVAIVGRPNVGKSTFLNSILEYHLAAVSDKPQTTRRNCLGILSDDTSQIIFIDTPGAHIGDTVLGKAMLSSVMRSMDDADLIFCIADPSRKPGQEDRLVAERVARSKKPVFLLLNKSDLTTDLEQQTTRDFYLEILGENVAVFATIATLRNKQNKILKAAREVLPQGPFFYEADQITDTFLRDIGAEVIRESIMAMLHEEVPHACHVEVESWKESENKLRVEATVSVERDTQKGIVVGRGGKMIKNIQKDARKRLAKLVADEDNPNRKVELKLYVKVSKDWRNKKTFLKDKGLA